MATNAPAQRCMVCGEYLEWEVAPDNRPAGSPLVVGPTDWQQKAHSCPPGATEAWLERIGFGAGLPAALAKEGMNVGPVEKQNIPDPPAIPINGPGAVGHSQVAPSMKATEREG